MDRKEELAWAAGLIDGEGCIGIDYKRRPSDSRHPSYRLRLRLNMTHKSTVIRLKRILRAGKVRFRKAGKSRWKDQYVWSVSGKIARRILIQLLPYLCTKLRDAKIGIKFRNFMDCVVSPGRGAYPLAVIRKQHNFYLRLRKKYGKYKIWHKVDNDKSFGLKEAKRRV